MAASPFLVLRPIGNPLPFKKVRSSVPVTITHVKGPERIRVQGARTGVPKPGFEPQGFARRHESRWTEADIVHKQVGGGHWVRLGEGLAPGLQRLWSSSQSICLKGAKKAEVSKIVTVVVTFRKGVELVEAANGAVVVLTKQRRGAKRRWQLMGNQIPCGSQPPQHGRHRLDRAAPRATLSAEGQCSLPRMTMDHSRDIHRRGSSHYGS
jgi:hypothetical protein